MTKAELIPDPAVIYLKCAARNNKRDVCSAENYLLGAVQIIQSTGLVGNIFAGRVLERYQNGEKPNVIAKDILSFRAEKAPAATGA